MEKYNSAKALSGYLKEIYGDDINFSVCDYIRLYGTLHGKKIEIELPNETVTVGVAPEDTELLDELIGCFNKLFGKEPICQYNLTQDDEVIDLTVEWDCENPAKRMEEVISGKAFNSGYKAVNIREYYMSERRMMELAGMNKFNPVLFGNHHISDEKFRQHFTEANEADLALMSMILGNFWNMVHSRTWNDIWPEPSDVEEAAEKLWEQIDNRFLNSESKSDIVDKRVAWSKWWSKYFIPEVILYYITKKTAGDDLSEFRPDGVWQANLIDPDYQEQKPETGTVTF